MQSFATAMRRRAVLLAVLLAVATTAGCAYQTLNGPGDPPRPNADDRLGPFN